VRRKSRCFFGEKQAVAAEKKILAATRKMCNRHGSVSLPLLAKNTWPWYKNPAGAEREKLSTPFSASVRI
jgi:hypothetical protein